MPAFRNSALTRVNSPGWWHGHFRMPFAAWRRGGGHRRELAHTGGRVGRGGAFTPPDDRPKQRMIVLLATSLRIRDADPAHYRRDVRPDAVLLEKLAVAVVATSSVSLPVRR